MSYGVDLIDLDRRSADYVDRILKGTAPGDLPVQAPTKLSSSSTSRARKSCPRGVANPPCRADEVIE